MYYGGAEGDGRLAEAMPDPDDSDAIDGSLRDRGIRHFGSSRVGGIPGECARENVPGRKSDVHESQGLMKRHTYGRLRNSFRAAQEIRRLRT